VREVVQEVVPVTVPVVVKTGVSMIKINKNYFYRGCKNDVK
jgi:hypothetical protein